MVWKFIEGQFGEYGKVNGTFHICKLKTQGMDMYIEKERERRVRKIQRLWVGCNCMLDLFLLTLVVSSLTHSLSLSLESLRLLFIYFSTILSLLLPSSFAFFLCLSAFCVTVILSSALSLLLSILPFFHFNSIAFSWYNSERGKCFWEGLLWFLWSGC